MLKTKKLYIYECVDIRLVEKNHPILWVPGLRGGTWFRSEVLLRVEVGMQYWESWLSWGFSFITA